jgi:hypothetical protein
MTRAEAEKVVGASASSRRAGGSAEGGVGGIRPLRARGDLRNGGRPVCRRTDDERTAGGLGVGSTFAELKRALPVSTVCLGTAKTAVCTTRGRALQTRFVVTRRRVSAVELRGG